LKKKRATKTAPIQLTARDLIKLATRLDPSTPVFVIAHDGTVAALRNSQHTGHGEIDVEGETCPCIVIATIME
jgi:hypothetical protein